MNLQVHLCSVRPDLKKAGGKEVAGKKCLEAQINVSAFFSS